MSKKRENKALKVLATTVRGKDKQILFIFFSYIDIQKKRQSTSDCLLENFQLFF